MYECGELSYKWRPQQSSEGENALNPNFSWNRVPVVDSSVNRYWNVITESGTIFIKIDSRYLLHIIGFQFSFFIHEVSFHSFDCLPRAQGLLLSLDGDSTLHPQDSLLTNQLR